MKVFKKIINIKKLIIKLKEKCKQYKNPKEEMQFEYDQAYNKSKSRFYTLENDKFLIYSSYENGFGLKI